jgi:hypothetical protein
MPATIRTTRRIFARNGPAEDPRDAQKRRDQEAVDALIARLDAEQRERTACIRRPPGPPVAKPAAAPAPTAEQALGIAEATPPVGPATTVLRAQRTATVSKYAAHEAQGIAALVERGIPEAAIHCVGAAEMLLTEDHMLVRFDYHARVPGEMAKRRFLVDVDMSFGRLVDAQVRPLGLIVS